MQSTSLGISELAAAVTGVGLVASLAWSAPIGSQENIFRDIDANTTAVDALADKSMKAPLPPRKSMGAKEPATEKTLSATRTEDRCYGPPDSQRRIIFLHGMIPAQAELDKTAYGEVIQDSAALHKARIFLPLSDSNCPGNPKSLCWLRQSPEQLKRALRGLVERARGCLSAVNEGIELHGHSNGAYFALAASEGCTAAGIRRVVAIGGGSAAVLPHQRAESGKKRPGATQAPAPCTADFHLAAAGRDRIQPELRRLVPTMRAAGMKARFHELPGGHDLTATQYRLLLDATGP